MREVCSEGGTSVNPHGTKHESSLMTKIFHNVSLGVRKD